MSKTYEPQFHAMICVPVFAVNKEEAERRIAPYLEQFPGSNFIHPKNGVTVTIEENPKSKDHPNELRGVACGWK